MSLPVDEAYLLGGWLASALWGTYSVQFGVSMYFILTSRRKDLYRSTTWVMIIMYALATAHVFISLRRTVVALIDLQRKPFGPITYLANISDNLNRVKDLMYITNIVLADCIITWRCYVVWAGDLRIVGLPILMIIGTAIAGYRSMSQYFLSNPSAEIADAWVTTTFAVSLTTNVIVTPATAGRIWYISRPQRKILGYSGNAYRTIVLLLIESGAVYAAAKITQFILFKLAPRTILGNHPFQIVYIMMPQITGMMPTLIIAVVNAGLTSTDAYGGAPFSLPTLPMPSATLTPMVFQARSSVSAFGSSTGGTQLI
ncbi:hypothetical protein M0805_008442 [Coniferiporia weirii]|nr:hypothetical protein M0805_008442 [Coniferiporia weirii]